jgi:uncharacterized protein (TIGR03118 family)
MSSSLTRFSWIGIGVSVFVAPLANAQYRRIDLVSDGSVPAPRTDPLLVNAWGLTHSPTGPFVVADNGTGTATAYNGKGVPVPQNHPTTIGIPPAGSGNPTDVAYNATRYFVVGSGHKQTPSEYIFISEDGTISGWNRTVNRTMALVASQDPEAIYKGVTLLCEAPYLYGTNFHEGLVEVYDRNFGEAGSFTDPGLPPLFAPFGIREFNGRLYVTFAMQDEDAEDDVPGPGHGIVDVFTPTGHLVRRLITGEPLNSPWGLAMAPDNFGEFSGALLVGNFGDGWINAFDPHDGTYLGPLTDRNSDPIVINGLWGLEFGNGAQAGPENVLYFTAGPNDEAGGLFGKIVAAP